MTTVWQMDIEYNEEIFLDRPVHHIWLAVGEETPATVLWRLLFYSFLMITFPIGSYFTSKTFLFEGLLEMSSSNSYFYAAILAIFVVHIILGLFIYVAWSEGSKTTVKKVD